MLESNKQNIGDVGSGAQINQAGGNVIVQNGLQMGDVIPLVKEIVQCELIFYQRQAEDTVRLRLDDFANQLESSIADKVADQVERFNEPAMQFAAREAALGYIKSGSVEEREALIDILIERVKEKEHTSKQMLIDEAIKILPKLSKESMATLTLLAYRQLSLTKGTSPELLKWFNCINPILDCLPAITKMDIAYLSQADCVTGLNGISAYSDWPKDLLKQYDVFYRHEVSPIDAQTLITKLGLVFGENGTFSFSNLPNDPHLLIFIIQLFSFNIDGSLELFGINSSTYEDVFSKIGIPEYIPIVKELIGKTKPFSVSEVTERMQSIHPNWPLAIKLFNEQPLSGYRLKPVGMYIASRQLSKLSGREITMDLFLK